MLTARFRTGKFVKTTPCTVETGRIGPILFIRQARVRHGNALPISLYYIINLATGQEDTNAEAEAA